MLQRISSSIEYFVEMYSRRGFLAVAGAGAVGGLAGCAGSSRSEYRPRDPGEYPDPTTHIRGSDGRWSSFGFDAANTRWDRDGRAPRDGVEVLWEFATGLPHVEPVARDGRVFVTDGDELLALDGENGAELWRAPARRGLTVLVFGDVVYHVGDDSTDGWALIARAVGSGEELWRAGVEATTGPAIGGGRHLVVASGETLHSLDPESGEVRWQRRLFGRINDGIAMADLSFPCVTTRAGMVYQLWDDDGDGLLRYQLPAPTHGPPTVGTDRIFVGAMDGRIYAIDRGGAGEGYWAWSAHVGGHAEGAIAYDGEPSTPFRPATSPCSRPVTVPSGGRSRSRAVAASHPRWSATPSTSVATDCPPSSAVAGPE